MKRRQNILHFCIKTVNVKKSKKSIGIIRNLEICYCYRTIDYFKILNIDLDLVVKESNN